ncbi:DUF3072 domain-containing protein [Palleronia sediminis]|nr:DUF3072 domain-containing protein [Palleronia sediminis]
MTDSTKKDPMGAATFPVAGAVVEGGDPKADEPMTEVQAAKLRELTEKTDEPFDANLTRGQAEARIEALEDRADD